MRNAKTAFLWIIRILKKHRVPYQVTGGLAAKIYGAKRKLNDIDIDISKKDFEIVKEKYTIEDEKVQSIVDSAINTDVLALRVTIDSGLKILTKNFFPKAKSRKSLIKNMSGNGLQIRVLLAKEKYQKFRMKLKLKLPKDT